MGFPEMISKLKYKPGWEFKFRSSDYGPVLDIYSTVPHSVTLEPSTFQFTRMIPVYLDTPKLFLSWMKTILIEAEVHELREFLRFDGELVDDPHAAVTV